LRGETAFNPLGGLMPGRFRLVMPTLSELALHEAAARALEALLLPPAEFALASASQSPAHIMGARASPSRNAALALS
jgi:hypothetical protein